MSDFFRTYMGHRFYEHTVPELVKQLARLNDNLERLNERLAAEDAEPSADGAGEKA